MLISPTTAGKRPRSSVDLSGPSAGVLDHDNPTLLLDQPDEVAHGCDGVKLTPPC
jgi:hypothetical protein